MTDISELTERMVTHTRRQMLAMVSLGDAITEMAGLVVVLMLLLPPDEAEALSRSFTKVALRAQSLNESCGEVTEDTLALIAAYQEFLLGRIGA